MSKLLKFLGETPQSPTHVTNALNRVFGKSSSPQNQVQQQLPVQAPHPIDVQAPLSNQSRKRKQPLPHKLNITARPHTSSRKRKRSPIPKYDDTEFTMKKTNILFF